MKKKVLVVDDEAAIVKLVSVYLSKEGYSVVGAFDGVEALEKVEQEKPDLVVLDISMPKMDGWEVCERMKKNPSTKDIPIIMLTALGYLAEEFRGLKMGAVRYITKPFSSKELVSAVNKILGSSE